MEPDPIKADKRKFHTPKLKDTISAIININKWKSNFVTLSGI